MNNINFSLTHAKNLPIYYIDTQNMLSIFLDKLKCCTMVALDTEFIRRTTYYPILALVQINIGDGIYIIDAPALDLSTLWQVLQNIELMIWYACREDLSIFYLLTGCAPLHNVFDVQIAIDFLGISQNKLSYANAIRHFLDTSIDKGACHSDWLMRPLSDAQIDYAADDVRYLLPLYHVVKVQLVKQKAFVFAQYDSRLCAKQVYDNEKIPPNQRYLDHIAPQHNTQNIVAMALLCRWREEVAKKTNKARTFILSKQSLRLLAENLPMTLRQLATCKLDSKQIRLYGKHLLRLIACAKNSKSHYPIPVQFDKDTLGELYQQIDDLCQAFALKHNIPAHTLLNKQTIRTLMLRVLQNDLDKSQYFMNESIFLDDAANPRQPLYTDVLDILRAHKTTLILAIMN